MDLTPIPSQTVGPFFHFITDRGAIGCLVTESTKGERIRLICRVLDGDRLPVDDAMIEIWQANEQGRYNHPDDPQGKALDPTFFGFGRLATDHRGICEFETIKPGRVPGHDGALQAPHINVSVFARGVMKRLATRVYFNGDPANPQDPVLALVAAERRQTLLAQLRGQRNWHFDIHLCGEQETVFFAI